MFRPHVGHLQPDIWKILGSIQIRLKIIYMYIYIILYLSRTL